MTAFQLAAIVITLTTALAYINRRVLRLPTSVGLMAIALLGSLAVLAVDALGWIDLSPRVRQLVVDFDFGNTLLHGLLGLLLFAGALQIDVAGLGTHKLAVAVLAVGSTLISTAVIGTVSYFVLSAMGVSISVVEAFVFGALISPTDPIAVLAMLRSADAPPELRVRIAGESLFNDGIGVVVFSVVLSVASGQSTSSLDALALFVRESGGGAAFGLITGYAAVRCLRTVDDYTVELLITVTLVLGGYAMAEAIHVSAPIAAVVAGLVIGNLGRRAMSDQTRVHVEMFWELIDQVLVAILYVMIGLVMLLVPLSLGIIEAMVVAVPIVLGARWISVAIPLRLLRPLRASTPHSVAILSWGGLRGGLSIAMALSLTKLDARDVVMVMTYGVVAFSTLVQGLTFKALLRRLHV